MAAMNTTIAPIFGSLAWIAVDYAKSGKIGSISYCSGVLAGLVAITPACGFVPPWAAIVIGTIAGVFGHFACSMKITIGYDDTLDAFGIHGANGFLGLILTGVFASSEIAAMDGTLNDGGGFLNGNWIQVGYQTAAAVVITVWCFFVTYLLAFIFSKIPALSLRCDVQDELKGLDYVQLGEKAYELASNAVLGIEEDHAVSRISVLNLKAVAEGSDGKVVPL
jgi:Amt family ammonium transporter